MPGTPNSESVKLRLDRCFQSLLNATDHDGMLDVIFLNMNASTLYVFPLECTGLAVRFTDACDDRYMVPPPIPLTFESCCGRGWQRCCATRSEMNKADESESSRALALYEVPSGPTAMT